MPVSPFSFIHKKIAPYFALSKRDSEAVKQTWTNMIEVLSKVYFKSENKDSTQLDDLELRKCLEEALTRLHDVNKVAAVINDLKIAKQHFITAHDKVLPENKTLADQKARITLGQNDYVQSTFNFKHKDPTKTVMIMNMCNDVRMGGVAFYKRGSAEEYLCRHSDLLMTMILDHLDDAKTPNIQQQWLSYIFKSVIAILKDKSLLNNPKHLQQQTLRALTLIYGAEGRAYQIHPNAPHFNPHVVLFDPSRREMPVLIQDVDVAAVDLRWFFGERRKVSHTFGMTIDPILFKNETKKRINAMMHSAIVHKTDILVLSALGCGAFGGDPKLVGECFAEVFNIHASALKGKQIKFDMFPDNYSKFVSGVKSKIDLQNFELSQPMIMLPMDNLKQQPANAKGWLPSFNSIVSYAWRQTNVSHPKTSKDDAANRKAAANK